MKIAVVGSGSWGTALALRLLENGHEVLLWSHNPSKAEEMIHSRQNPKLPGVMLPAQLQITASACCVSDCEMVVIACPSSPIRSVCRAVAPHIPDNAVVVTVTKGIEQGTLLRMSQVVSEETGHPVVSLTGPSHAEEVAMGMPAGLLAACPDKALAEMVQKAFISEVLRVYTSPDIVGAELGGALKNVIALCAGICDGQKQGDNAKAMLITRGLTEIARLGVAMGAHKDTLAGLSGIGDLIVTCTSVHSRNRKAGMLIGQGKTPQQALEAVGSVVEGYYTALSAWELGKKYAVDLPIISGAYEILYQGRPAQEVVKNLLLRRRKAESEDAGWQ